MYMKPYAILLLLVNIFFVTFEIGKIVKADAVELNIATHDSTFDWHPINAESYPAQLVIRLTTEHLLEETCRGKNGFLNICLSKLVTINKKDQRINLNSSYINQSQCKGLDEADIQFTLDQINKNDTNVYKYFKLRIKENRLVVGNPFPAPAETVRQAISFPIIRKPRDTTIITRSFATCSE